MHLGVGGLEDSLRMSESASDLLCWMDLFTKGYRTQNKNIIYLFCGQTMAKKISVEAALRPAEIYIGGGGLKPNPIMHL